MNISLIIFSNTIWGMFFGFWCRRSFRICPNFVFMGSPIFALGLLAKKHEDRLRRTSKCVIIACIGIGVLEALLSRYFIGKNELYIGSLFILFAIVVVFVKFPNVKCSNVVSAITGLSTYIYVFHMMISSIVLKMYLLMRIDYNSSVLIQMIHPIIVCAVSTVVAYIITKIKFLLKKR